MKKSVLSVNLLRMFCLSLLLAFAAPRGAYARAEAKAIDVFPGAFGEAIDTLDDVTAGWCIEYEDRALQELIKDFENYMEEASQDGYLQILQTTLLLPGSLPFGATDVEQEIWAELYESAACVVSFVTIDNSMNWSGMSYAEVTGLFEDYGILQDGSGGTLLPARHTQPFLRGSRCSRRAGDQHGKPLQRNIYAHRFTRPEPRQAS